MADAELVRKHLSFIETDKGAAVGFVLDNIAEKDSASRIVVLLNGEREATSFNVPAGNYTVVANGEKVAVDGISKLSVKEGSPVKVGAIEPLILIAE